MTRAQAPCVFGEVLFDVFPDGQRVLGGAPFNVAWHLQAFGLGPRFVSRVGEDADGRAIRDAMREWGMDDADLQVDAERPSGRVEVHIEDGEPRYDIVEDCAYDAVDATSLQPATGALLYHGSLAVRCDASARALARLREGRPRLVFMDVNLRDPWWRAEQVLSLVAQADWLKLNEHELRRLGGAGGDLGAAAGAFRDRHGLRGLLVTCGAAGAVAVTGSGETERVSPTAKLQVVDTVGAGDAFAAAAILGLVRGWPLPLLLARAQAFAEHLVTRRGATIADPAFYRTVGTDWSN